ncbi:MAG: PAS domain S-box protein [Syntrophales bacterium]|nr:PAS domain S-box protein [Syntrophales bacterium]
MGRPRRQSAFDILHPNDAGRIADVFYEALDHKKPIKVEYRARHAEGHYVWLETVGDLLRDDRGEALAVIMCSRDITDRNYMEKALRESESRFYNLFQQMNSGVAIYEAVDGGKDFIFRDFNRAAERMEGIGKEELPGRRVTEVFPGVRDHGLLDVFRRVWRTGHPEDHDIFFMTVRW